MDSSKALEAVTKYFNKYKTDTKDVIIVYINNNYTKTKG